MYFNVQLKHKLYRKSPAYCLTGDTGFEIEKNIFSHFLWQYLLAVTCIVYVCLYNSFRQT